MARTLARLALSVIIILQLATGYLLTVDPTLGATLFEPWPSIVVTHKNSELPHRAVVFLTGTQSSGLTHSEDIRYDFFELGSFVVVEYDREAFDKNVIIAVLLEQLRELGITEIYLVGSSLGGLVALDLVAKNNLTHTITVLGVILSNVPRGQIDLYDQRARAISRFHAGPLANRLLGFIIQATFRPPAPGPGVRRSLLQRHHLASKTWPISGWLDQVRTIVNHPGFRPEELRPVYAVLIVADGDDVVKPDATDYWQQLLQVPNDRILHVDSGHEQYVDDPLPWHKVMKQAAQLLAAAR